MLNTRMCGLLIFLVFIFASCTARYDRNLNGLAGITIPFSEMNKAFEIEDLPVMANSYKNGKALALVLRNLSDKTIVFPDNYSPEILLKQKQTWVKVQNYMSTYGNEILPTQDSFPPGMEIDVTPYIQGLQEPVNIRIVMIGHNENSDMEVVGAYIDITLLP
jgi:hypothetical protein